MFARQTIPCSTLQTAMARHHSFTSSQSEIKSTTTLPSHHPHPHPDHSRHILDDHHQPCALVVPKPARPSKQGAVRLEFEPVLWHSAQLLSTACGSCAEPREAVYSTESSCGNCRRDNRFPNSDARCALVPADTVWPEKACVQCFARITRAFNSYSQITYSG